jgi:hypothetical protein
MKVEELPAVVIKRITLIFQSIFLIIILTKTCQKIRGKFIAYDIGTDHELESYLLIMQTKNSSLSATYNGKGKLIRVVRIIDVRLPNEVIFQFTELTLTTPSLTTSTYTLKKKVIS